MATLAVLGLVPVIVQFIELGREVLGHLKEFKNVENIPKPQDFACQ